MEKIKKCQTCDYYEAIYGVCCNGKSEQCADFVYEHDTCEQWENVDIAKRYRRLLKTD